MPNGKDYCCAAGYDEKRARQKARFKERDLTHGLFNADELTRLRETGSDGPMTIDMAIERYIQLTAHNKSGDTRGLWTPEREGVMSDRCPFVRHDLCRFWSAHAKVSGCFNVEEASQVLGHDPSVNIQHYAGRGNDTSLWQKMAAPE